VGRFGHSGVDNEWGLLDIQGKSMQRGLSLTDRIMVRVRFFVTMILPFQSLKRSILQEREFEKSA